MLLQLCPGSLYTQTIQFWWSSAVAVSAKKFVRSRSHSGWFPDVFSSRVESRAALSGKELGRLGLAIHWGICGHGNRITPEHHTSHHCRTYPFCITSKHTSSGNIAYMMYMYIYIYDNLYVSVIPRPNNRICVWKCRTYTRSGCRFSDSLRWSSKGIRGITLGVHEELMFNGRQCIIMHYLYLYLYLYLLYIAVHAELMGIIV